MRMRGEQKWENSASPTPKRTLLLACCAPPAVTTAQSLRYKHLYCTSRAGLDSGRAIAASNAFITVAP
jgi:hypothetical protein